MLGNDLQFDPSLLDDRDAFAKWMSDLVLQVNRVSNLRGDGQYISVASSQLSTSIKFHGAVVEEGGVTEIDHFPCAIISHSPAKPDPEDQGDSAPTNRYTYQVRRVVKRPPRSSNHDDEGAPSNEGYGEIDATEQVDGKGSSHEDSDGKTVVRAKYGAWMLTTGGNPLTAYNFLENMNKKTGVQGNGVDRSGINYPAVSYTHLTLPTTPYV